MAPVSQRTYSVTGMTCEHCVLSVREEVAEVAGVS
ncbi:MAG: cation transporter, partial [Thermoleophilaceae bacterium]|nr:cation transporter [Thermoleophilaceae bacterium]